LSGLTAVGVAQLVAAATATAVLFATGSQVPAGAQLLLAMLAGLFHLSAVYFLYEGMARGRVSIIAPVAGLVGIAVPVIADLGFIETAAPIHCAGIALAAVAILLFSQSSSKDEDSALTGFSIRYGILSGMGYGLADLALGLMTVETAEGGLAAARLTGASIAIVIMAALYIPTRGGVHSAASGATASRLEAAWRDPRLRVGLALCALAGFLDCLGQLGYVLSATQGQISVAVALVAMYPAVSVGLAVWLLRERIGPTQWAGLATSGAGITLLVQ
jgi:drug/metabolite transporter (DMT)-like permease